MHKETSLQTLGQRQRLLEWSQKIADCRQSGLSIKRWCSENGINIKTYYSWQKKVFEFMVEQQKAQLEAEEHSCFVELPTPQAQPCMQQIHERLIASIQIGGASVNLYAGAEPKLVQAICQALTSC
jgi:hypothetical protein